MKFQIQNPKFQEVKLHQVWNFGFADIGILTFFGIWNLTNWSLNVVFLAPQKIE